MYMKPARGPQTMFFLSMIVVGSLLCRFEWGLGRVFAISVPGSARNACHGMLLERRFEQPLF